MIARFIRVAACVLSVGFCSRALCAKDTAEAPEARQRNAAESEQSPGCIPKEKDRNRHDGFMKDKARLEKKGNIDLVFIGDSITDGWRGGPQHAGFVKTFGQYNPFNTGISGDETQHCLWRIDHGELDGLHPKVVEIMIGTNNLGNSHQTPAQTIAGIKCVVKAVHAKVPNANILLLGVFPRGRKADDPFRAKIKEVNEALAKMDGKDNVKYLDIGDKFLEPDGTLPASIMPDALHPNVKGYEIWAAAIAPTVDRLEKQ